MSKKLIEQLKSEKEQTKKFIEQVLKDTNNMWNKKEKSHAYIIGYLERGLKVAYEYLGGDRDKLTNK